MNLRYVLGSLISIPLLPLMYYQGNKIRKGVPALPEAINTSGLTEYKGESRKTIQMIALGESTIAGIGVNTHEEGFTGAFAKEFANLKKVNIKWRVYAKSGYTVEKVTQKLLPKVDETQVDLFIIGIGANDAFRLNNPSRWRKDIRKLIKSCNSKYPNAKIAFCNMPPIKEFPAFTPLIKFTIGNLVEILGKELKKVVTEFPYTYYFDEKITIEKWSKKLDRNFTYKDFFSDGVHPSKITYQTWGKEFANKVAASSLLKL